MEEAGRITRCRCGGEPVRIKKRTRHGMRWWVQCQKCNRRTKKHRPNGGDLHEWERMNSLYSDADIAGIIGRFDSGR